MKMRRCSHQKRLKWCFILVAVVGLEGMEKGVLGEEGALTSLTLLSMPVVVLSVNGILMFLLLLTRNRIERIRDVFKGRRGSDEG